MSPKSNLLKLLILFKNRPAHLYRYLLDNQALKDEFLNLTVNSQKLQYLDMPDNLNFANIDEMNDFFDSLIDNSKNIETLNDKEKKWNQKLSDALISEDYESASRIRDYMKKHNLRKF